MTKSIFYCRNGSISIFIHWLGFCGILSSLMAVQTYIHPRFIPRFSILCFLIYIICEIFYIKWRRAPSHSHQPTCLNSMLSRLAPLPFPHDDSALGIPQPPLGSHLLPWHCRGEGRGRWARTLGPGQHGTSQEKKHEGSKFCQRQ